MEPQNYEKKDAEIDKAFDDLQKNHAERLKRPINLSWSNWGFGMEPLADSAARLKKFGVDYIELHGNHYGPDLGYDIAETKNVLADHGLTVSGVCGMFSVDNDLSSSRAIHRQAAVDYIKREVEFAHEMGGSYLLVVPGAVGRPAAYDDSEIDRSVETLSRVAHLFEQSGVKAAIEPIRSAEVSLVNSFADAKEYIRRVGHPGVGYINGDLYHMLLDEEHIPTAIVDAGDMLVNLHAADTTRRALGIGFLDLDRAIKALYLIGFNQAGRFVTPEPLGPGGDPYPAMHGHHDPRMLDEMVRQTATYFREREALYR